MAHVPASLGATIGALQNCVTARLGVSDVQRFRAALLPYPRSCQGDSALRRVHESCSTSCPAGVTRPYVCSEEKRTSPTTVTSKRPALALLASDQEWSSRSLETVLGPSGYVVIRAYTGGATLSQAVRAHPDVILLDVHLPDWDGLQLCRALRDEPKVGLRTPIVMLAASPPTRHQRVAALRAGAWDVLSLPAETEELLLKLEAYARGRVEADQLPDGGLVDQASGLYNVRGLERRARELGSEARRQHKPVACVVFGADVDREHAATTAGVSEEMARVLRRAGRVSDAIGRLSDTEFAVLAPDTDATAAVTLAQRLMDALQEGRQGAVPLRSPPSPPPPLRVGYEAVDNLGATPGDPVDPLSRATKALQSARPETYSRPIRRHATPPATQR